MEKARQGKEREQPAGHTISHNTSHSSRQQRFANSQGNPLSGQAT
jgi:hypothetical protein